MGDGSPMPPTQPGTKLTFEDYRLFPSDGQRHELIDGEHYVTPSPVLRHQCVSGRLFLALARSLETHPVGAVFYAPLTTILSNHDVVEPDLLYVSNERRAILQDWVRGVPNLVIEILSPSSCRLDETIKRKLYDRAGVDEYWIVDPELDLVKVHRRVGDTFVRAAELTREEGHTLTTPLLPGLEIVLENVFT